MISAEIKVNYHSYLGEIRDVLDPVVKKMRDQNGKPWRGQAWKGPLKQAAGYAKQFKVISTLKWASLPVIGPVLTGFVTSWITSIPLGLIILGSLLMAGLIYYFYVRWYIGKMATIGDERFHVEAFKAKRPTEYAIWQQFVAKNDFTFNGLYQFVNIAFNQSGDGGHIDRLVAYTEGQQEQLQQSVQVLSTTIENQKQAIGMLEEELELSENAISYLVGLIKKINENLYRLTNDKLELHDMDFITGFSLYRRENEFLKLILDKGTSGASKETLALEASDGQHYAVVDAANSETEEAFSNNPYPGRIVVAFRMKMAGNQVWIWSFHFDDDDERALSLTLSNAIIESRQIRRLVHAFCLILQKRMLAGEESDLDAVSQ